MERKKGKTTRRCSQRLLKIFVFSLFVIYDLSLASQTIQSQDVVSLNSSYKIERLHSASIKLDFDHLLFLSFKISTRLRIAPKIIIDVDNVKLQQSKVYHLQDATIIEAQYKLLKAGHIRLCPVLVVDGIEVQQEIIEVLVQSPPLSQATQFRVNFFDVKDGKLIPLFETEEGKKELYAGAKENVLIAGHKYLLIIEGFFKRDVRDDVSVRFFNGKHAGDQSFVEAGFFIEKIEDDFKSFKKNVDLADGWQFLQAFYFYPLRKGKLSNIEWSIQIKRGNEKVFSFIVKDQLSLTVERVDNEIKAERGEKRVQQEFKQTLDAYMDQNQRSESMEAIQIEKALKVKYLREMEQNTWFSGDAKMKRLKLEEELDLSPSFAPFNAKWFALKIAIALLFLLISVLSCIILYFMKQKTLRFWNIALFVMGAVFLIFTVWNDVRKEEYTHAGQNRIFLYSFPSEASSHIADVEIGETVRILNKHKDWTFVEKTDHKRGWMK